MCIVKAVSACECSSCRCPRAHVRERDRATGDRTGCGLATALSVCRAVRLPARRQRTPRRLAGKSRRERRRPRARPYNYTVKVYESLVACYDIKPSAEKPDNSEKSEGAISHVRPRGHVSCQGRSEVADGAVTTGPVRRAKNSCSLRREDHVILALPACAKF